MPKNDAEEWRPVVGFETLYEVSNHGRVKSLGRPSQKLSGKRSWPSKILAPLFGRGHLKVSLYQHGFATQKWVHTLILEAFVCPRPKGKETRHLDGNAFNNHVFNLAWGTPAENNADKKRHGTERNGERCYNAKLAEDSVREIRRLRLQGISPTELSRQFCVDRKTIYQIVKRRRWAHVQ